MTTEAVLTSTTPTRSRVPCKFKQLDHPSLEHWSVVILIASVLFRQIKVRKLSTMTEAFGQIAEAVKHAPEDIRVWLIMNRYNSTTRPLNIIDLKEVANKTVQEVCKQDVAWTIFVETPSDQSFETNEKPATVLPTYNYKADVMLFFKFYEPKTSTLRYVFRMHLSVTLTLSE